MIGFRKAIFSAGTGMALLASFGFLVGSTRAQHAPVKMDVDYAAFAYDEAVSLVEVYIGVEAASLDFEAAEADGFVASLPLRLELAPGAATDTGETRAAPVWADSTVLRFALPDTAGMHSGHYFTHQMRSAVPPDDYVLHLTVPDMPARPGLRIRQAFPVGRFEPDGAPALSDITLATGIAPNARRNDPFFKNGLLVHPSPNRLFGEGLRRMYYYAEAYGAGEIGSDRNTYIVYTYVADADRLLPIADLENRSDRTVRSPDVLVGSFDTGGLPTGSYVFHMVLLDEQNEGVVERSRKFFVYNPGVSREDPAILEIDFETSSYAEMSEDEVEQGMAHARLIANDMERRRMRRLSELDARRRFLMDFWQKRDAQPMTPVNEFKEGFYRRVQYANDRYTSNIEAGWQSDRGRVVITYGLPNDIEPHLYDQATVPHEIWQYNNIPGHGQSVFVFADVTGFGSFELLHSSVPGERSLPNWQSALYRR